MTPDEAADVLSALLARHAAEEKLAASIVDRGLRARFSQRLAPTEREAIEIAIDVLRYDPALDE